MPELDRRERRILTPREVAETEPQSFLDADRMTAARERLRDTGQWGRLQMMGRRWPIGCVALEITQRCNLDCSACYLSENSELVRDLPLDEVFRRIDRIAEHYGPGTGVQVTGGEPTLRRRDELIAIVRRIAERDMEAALFTNGIRAKRELIAALCSVGLVDIAFHVDLTQRRRGYASEAALNDLRRDYIERTRGLPVHVMFNTTVTNETLDQVADLAEFFVANSDVVRLASFQLQADTGRGTLGKRMSTLTADAVQHQIERGAGTALSFDTLQAGHRACNRTGAALVTNGRVHDAYDDKDLMADVLSATAGRYFDRRRKAMAVRNFLRGLVSRPRVGLRFLRWAGAKAWRARDDLIAAHGRVRKLSFFIHDFMDACALEKDRIHACSFMAMTQDGPISMCLHNAKRDQFILAPLRLAGVGGTRTWQPLAGVTRRNPNVEIVHRAVGAARRLAGRS